MPVVPSYSEFQAAPAQAPQARFAAPEPSIDPGRDLRESGQASMQAGNVIARIAHEAQQEANQTRVDDGLNQVVMERMRLTFDGEEGYSNLKGKAALERPDGKSLTQEYSDKLGKVVSEIDASLGNEPQKIAFRKQAAGLRAQFEAGVGQHVNREYMEHRIGVAQTHSDAGEQQSTLNWGNPELVEQGLGAVRAGVQQEGRLRGWSDEQIANATIDRVTRVHSNVVKQAVEAGRLDYAGLYLEQHAAEMGPGARVEGAKLLRQHKERAAFVAADQLVRDSREDKAGLQRLREQLRSDQFTDLSPEGRGQIEQRILARQQYLDNQAEIANRRAEAAAARKDRQAESAAKSLQMMLDSGAIPDDATVAKLSARVSGTDYAKAVSTMLQSAHEQTSFAQLTPRDQRAAIVQARSKVNATGSSPAMEKRLANFERIADRSERELAEDPLKWGVDRRLIDAQPLNFGNIDQLTAHIAQRSPDAAAIGARTGAPTSPLFKVEAERASEMLMRLPQNQRVAAVRQIARNVDPQQIMALGRQIGGKDSALGLAMFSVAGLPVNAPELILRGEDARTTKRVRDDEASRLHHQRIARELDAVPWPTVQARDAATEAARLIYDGLRDANGGSANVNEAIRLATNGLAEWNGSRVPLPQGWDERRFRRALASIEPAKLTAQAGGQQVTVRGQPMTTEQLARGMGAVTLIPAGSGRYALESGGALVLTAKGVPLRIQLGD